MIASFLRPRRHDPSVLRDCSLLTSLIVRHPTRSLLCSCRCPLLTLSDPLLSAQPCRLLSSTSKPRGSCLSSDLWVRENLALSSQSEWPPPPRAGSTGHLLSRGSLVGAPTRRFPQRLRGTRGEDSIEAAPPFLTPPGGSVPLSSVPPVCCFAFFFFSFRFPFSHTAWKSIGKHHRQSQCMADSDPQATSGTHAATVNPKKEVSAPSPSYVITICPREHTTSTWNL